MFQQCYISLPLKTTKLQDFLMFSGVIRNITSGKNGLKCYKNYIPTKVGGA